MLLTQEALADGLPSTGEQCVYLDAEWTSDCDGSRRTTRHRGAMAENLAYVIYTSGSTGRPKGALLAHRRPEQHRAGGGQARWAWGRTSRVLQFAASSFDASVWECSRRCCAGARRWSWHRARSYCRAPALRALLVSERITAVTLTPSVLAQLLTPRRRCRR